LKRLEPVNEVLYLVVLNHFVAIFQCAAIGWSYGERLNIDVDEVGFEFFSFFRVLSDLELKVCCKVLILILNVDF
jgi:hypothetical protein